MYRTQTLWNMFKNSRVWSWLGLGCLRPNFKDVWDQNSKDVFEDKENIEQQIKRITSWKESCNISTSINHYASSYWKLYTNLQILCPPDNIFGNKLQRFWNTWFIKILLLSCQIHQNSECNQITLCMFNSHFQLGIKAPLK